MPQWKGPCGLLCIAPQTRILVKHVLVKRVARKHPLEVVNSLRPRITIMLRGPVLLIVIGEALGLLAVADGLPVVSFHARWIPLEHKVQPISSLIPPLFVHSDFGKTEMSSEHVVIQVEGLPVRLFRFIDVVLTEKTIPLRRPLLRRNRILLSMECLRRAAEHEPWKQGKAPSNKMKGVTFSHQVSANT